MLAKPNIVVIGAGAFGGWTALYLLRAGARVTLLDAWGPGNSRSSSGGETRVIRGAYGPDQPYTKLAARALELWKENQAQWKQKVFFPIGVLWMVEGTGEFERGSLPLLKEAGIPFEQLSTGEMARRWPQINFDNVEWGIYEPESGYLLARASAQAVVEHFIAEGGAYRQAAVVPNQAPNQLGTQELDSGAWKELPLSDGSTLAGDRYVFACGPWLGKLFPQTIGPHFVATKQDVFFFGLQRAIRATTKPTFPSGPITSITLCTAFPEIRDAASKWPTTRAARNSIPRMVSDWSARIAWPKRSVILHTVFRE